MSIALLGGGPQSLEQRIGGQGGAFDPHRVRGDALQGLEIAEIIGAASGDEHGVIAAQQSDRGRALRAGHRLAEHARRRLADGAALPREGDLGDAVAVEPPTEMQLVATERVIGIHGAVGRGDLTAMPGAAEVVEDDLAIKVIAYGGKSDAHSQDCSLRTRATRSPPESSASPIGASISERLRWRAVMTAAESSDLVTGETPLARLRAAMAGVCADRPEAWVALEPALERLASTDPVAPEALAALVESATADDPALTLALLRAVHAYQQGLEGAARDDTAEVLRNTGQPRRWPGRLALAAALIAVAVGLAALVLGWRSSVGDNGHTAASPTPKPVVVLSGTLTDMSAGCPGTARIPPPWSCAVPVTVGGSGLNASVTWDTADQLAIGLADSTGRDVAPQVTGHNRSASFRVEHLAPGSYFLRVVNVSRARGPIHFDVSYQG